MYIVVGSYKVENKNFKTIEDAEAYCQLEASQYGNNYKRAICKVEKMVATNPVEVAYATLTAEEYLEKVEQRKQAYKTLGVDSTEIDYD